MRGVYSAQQNIVCVRVRVYWLTQIWWGGANAPRKTQRRTRTIPRKTRQWRTQRNARARSMLGLMAAHTHRAIVAHHTHTHTVRSLCTHAHDDDGDDGNPAPAHTRFWYRRSTSLWASVWKLSRVRPIELRARIAAGKELEHNHNLCGACMMVHWTNAASASCNWRLIGDSQRSLSLVPRCWLNGWSEFHSNSVAVASHTSNIHIIYCVRPRCRHFSD